MGCVARRGVCCCCCCAVRCVMARVALGAFCRNLYSLAHPHTPHTQVPGVYCRWTGVYEEIGDHLKDDCKYAIGKPLFRVGCKYCSETFLVPQLEAHESVRSQP